MSSAMWLIYLPALYGRCTQPLLESQNTAPATLLLEFCAFFDWITLLLEHCPSLEKAPCFLALSPTPLPPWPQWVRDGTSCLYYAVGNSEPHRGEVALEVLKANTPGIPCDLATFPPV